MTLSTISTGCSEVFRCAPPSAGGSEFRVEETGLLNKTGSVPFGARLSRGCCRGEDRERSPPSADEHALDLTRVGSHTGNPERNNADERCCAACIILALHPLQQRRRISAEHLVIVSPLQNGKITRPASPGRFTDHSPDLRIIVPGQESSPVFLCIVETG